MALVFVVEQPPFGFVVVTVIQLAGVAVVGALGETCLAFGVDHKMRAPYRRMGDQIAAASEQVQPLDLRSWSGSECRRPDQHMARDLGPRVPQQVGRASGTEREC